MKGYRDTPLFLQSFCLHYLFSRCSFSSMCIQWWCSDIWTRKPMTDAPASLLILSSNQAHGRRDQRVVIPDDWGWMRSDLRVSLACTSASVRKNVRNGKLHMSRVPQSSTFSQKNLCPATYSLEWAKGEKTKKISACQMKEIDSENTEDEH